jgi:hypothetical protein
MHREKLVVGIRPEHHVVRLLELRAHEKRLDAPGREEDERRPEVEKADALVVGGRQPAEDSRALDPDPLEPLDALVRGCRDSRRYRCASR